MTLWKLSPNGIPVYDSLGCSQTHPPSWLEMWWAVKPPHPNPAGSALTRGQTAPHTRRHTHTNTLVKNSWCSFSRCRSRSRFLFITMQIVLMRESVRRLNVAQFIFEAFVAFVQKLLWFYEPKPSHCMVLTWCDVLMVSESSPEASASLGSLCCFLWSGDGVSCGRLGGGPGLCSGAFFRSKTCHKHTCRHANTS